MVSFCWAIFVFARAQRKNIVFFVRFFLFNLLDFGSKRWIDLSQDRFTISFDIIVMAGRQAEFIAVAVWCLYTQRV